MKATLNICAKHGAYDALALVGGRCPDCMCERGAGEEERTEAIALLTKWLKDTPRYAGDEPRAMHYQQNVRALTVAIEALSRPAPSSDREATIEECARVADAEADNRDDGSSPWDNGSGSCAWAAASNRIAERIRALAASPGAMVGGDVRAALGPLARCGGYYKPELPHFTVVEVPLEYLKRAHDAYLKTYGCEPPPIEEELADRASAALAALTLKEPTP